MNDLFQKILSSEHLHLPHNTFWWVVGLLLGIHGFLMVMIAAFFRPNESAIIFSYNVYFGVDLLASWWQAQLVPLLSLALSLGNLSFAYYFRRRKEWLLSTLFLLGSSVLAFTLAVAVFALVLINY